MKYFYEILKANLQALEVVHGLPDSMITREWDAVPTSMDGLWVIIESSEPLDESILGVAAITLEQSIELMRSPKYQLPID